MLLLIRIVLFPIFVGSVEINFDIDTDDNPNAIYVFGTDTNFKKITCGTICYYNDNSCYDVIFDIFNRDDRVVPYVSMVPIMYNMDCSYVLPYRNVSMYSFGIYKNMKEGVVKKCVTFGECMMAGCELYNSDSKILYFVLGGRV